MSVDDQSSVPLPASDKQPSRHDLFMYKRKKTDVKEYFNAKSVVNLDDEEDEAVTA